MPEYASWRRRIAALIIDWAASTLVTVGIIGPGSYLEDPDSGWIVLGVFALEVSLLTTLTGGSFGQLLTRVRVLSTTTGRSLNLLVALARTLLICLVIPPLVFKQETGRGLHDLWTGSAAYTR